MTEREIVLSNIEYRSDGPIGMVFKNRTGRLNDFTGSSVRHDIETDEWEEGGYLYYTDIWGNTWYRVSGMSKGGEVYKPAIEDWSKLDNLELPELDKPEYFEHARELCTSGTTRYRNAFLPGWTFATSRYLRKMDIYFTDLIAYRDHVDELHDRVTSLLERVIDRFGEAGMDGVMFCEDLGVQDRLLMSPEMWRDIFRPHYERLTSRAHSHGMKVIQHSCGYNRDLVDDLCEAGIDCLQFDQTAVYDMPALAKKLRGHGVGLFSPCDIQQVLPTGDRARIEAETKRLVETFRGGFIAKDYGDLHGIGVEPEWDEWAYRTFETAGERAGADSQARAAAG